MLIDIQIPGCFLEDFLTKIAGAANVSPERLRLAVLYYNRRGDANHRLATFLVLLDETPTAEFDLTGFGIVQKREWWGTNEETTREWDRAASAIWAALDPAFVPA